MDGSTVDVRMLSRPEDRASGPFAALLGSFHQNGIAYCYWRSGRRVEAALAGDSDLDLLVAKPDQYRSQEILLQAGFKCFPAVAHRDHPAISSFLGYDAASGRIVHIHLYVRLLVGGALLKTHHLRWEENVLARAVWHPGLPIRVLDPADEAVLMLVRSSLELRRTDPVALWGWTALKRKFATDRAELVAQVDRTTLLNRAGEVFSDKLAGLLVEGLFGTPSRSVQRRIRRRVRKELAAWRTTNAVEAHVRTAARGVLYAAGRLNAHYLRQPRPWRRRAPGGGCVAALVGVDGSGKTTIMAAIREWLEPEIDVLPIYFGTGEGRPSLLLLPLKLILPLVMSVMRTKPRGSSHGRVSDRAPGPLYSLLMTGWAGVLSVEKRIKLLAARRGADRGLLVIADRYPQADDPAYNDGPLLPRLKWAPGWLRAFEARSYRMARRLPPDLVLRLDVSAETIGRREPTMDRGVIRTRIAGLRRMKFPEGTRVVCVDAERPFPEVLRTVKHEIWRML
jgi:hypothetical protein